MVKKIIMPEKGTFSIKTFPLQNKKVVTKIKKNVVEDMFTLMC